MKTLIIYDVTGKIWLSMSVDDAPRGLEKYIFEVPEYAMLDHMDMTDPAHPVPVYEQPAETVDLGQMVNDITDIQVALAEVYELLAGGQE